MSLPWITVNSKLQTGISLINTIPLQKFSSLLSHIGSVKREEIFTSEELKKLETSLKLKDDEVQLLVLSIKHIIRNASKVILKPTVLKKQLIDNLKFNEDKADEFIKFWTQCVNEDFNLENRDVLEDIRWELNLETASTFNNKEITPNARIQFKFERDENNLTLEFNEQELLDLYNVLENVQAKLDAMT